jgi:hypothetical protein
MLPSRLKQPRTKWIKTTCMWCGITFKAARYGALTCRNACRLRLCRFRAETGFNPERPPGDITCKAALDILIMTLLIRERLRRERLAAR